MVLGLYFSSSIIMSMRLFNLSSIHPIPGLSAAILGVSLYPSSILLYPPSPDLHPTPLSFSVLLLRKYYISSGKRAKTRNKTRYHGVMLKAREQGKEDRVLVIICLVAGKSERWESGIHGVLGVQME